MTLRKTRKERQRNISLRSALNAGLTKVLESILKKLKEEHDENAFWVTIVLPQKAGEIRGHLWLTTDRLDAVARFYQKKISDILSSNKTIMMDKNL